MKHFLKKVFAYSLIFICFLLVYGVVCDLLYKNRNMFLGNSKRYWQLSIKNNNYDYAVIGSSRAYGSINVNFLDSLTDQKGINLGLNGSGFNENYVSLKLFLMNRNEIDKIYLQIDPYSFMSKESFSNSFHAYAYLPWWDSDKNIQDVLHEEIPIIKDSPFYIPYLGYYIYNNYYSPMQIINSFLKHRTFCENSEFNCINGNKFEKHSIIHKSLVKDTEILKFAMNKGDKYYYDLILELAAINNIQIITFTAPTLDHFDNKFENFLQYNKTEVYFKPDKNWKLKDKYFKNKTHLNYEGGEVFTAEFAKFITSSNL